MIRNIIFDLGNVLVNVEYERFIDKLTASGVSKEAYMNFFKGGNYRLLGYESGEISTDEFVTKCLTGLNLDMERNDYANAFNDMFSEIEPMRALVRKLKSQNNYRLFLLSNTSPLHFEYIKQKYDYVNLLEKYALSYELKSLKPEAVIYERTISHLGILPEESVFIDDLQENCDAAEEFGIKTICYDKNDHAGFEKMFQKMFDS
ncbi:MAG TPA: HAD family phosphatase [Ignavibacteria bacterium]|nr:HAD family phosphatase [Ignavibacteria bacterium]HMQ98711.1 HAD family phosphatase [Ignavibacteria bacterium]